MPPNRMRRVFFQIIRAYPTKKTPWCVCIKEFFCGAKLRRIQIYPNRNRVWMVRVNPPDLPGATKPAGPVQAQKTATTSAPGGVVPGMEPEPAHNVRRCGGGVGHQCRIGRRGKNRMPSHSSLSKSTGSFRQINVGNSYMARSMSSRNSTIWAGVS